MLASSVLTSSVQASSVRAGIISAGWHQVLPLEKTDNNDNGSDYAKFMYFI